MSLGEPPITQQKQSPPRAKKQILKNLFNKGQIAGIRVLGRRRKQEGYYNRY